LNKTIKDLKATNDYEKTMTTFKEIV
jgi:hypothetical protein